MPIDPDQPQPNERQILEQKLVIGPCSVKDLAAYWELTRGRISQLASKGMPMTNLAEASEWRNKGKAGSNHPGHSGISLNDGESAIDEDIPETLEDSLRHHRTLTARARRRWERAQSAGVPEEQKLYQIYQASQMAEIKIEREIKAQKLESRELMRTQDAIDDFTRVLADIRNDVVTLPMELASKANPDDPAKALKAIDERVQRLLAKWSNVQIDAVERIATIEPAEPVPREDETAIDEVISDDDEM